MTVEYIDADVSEDYSGLLLFDVNDSGRTATVSGLKYTASEPYASAEFAISLQR